MHFVYLKQKVMNIKQQPFFNKLSEHCVTLCYRCNVFYTENVHVNNTRKTLKSATLQCRQLRTHVWTISLINGIILRHEHLPKISISNFFVNKPVASMVNFIYSVWNLRSWKLFCSATHIHKSQFYYYEKHFLRDEPVYEIIRFEFVFREIHLGLRPKTT